MDVAPYEHLLRKHFPMLAKQALMGNAPKPLPPPKFNTQIPQIPMQNRQQGPAGSGMIQNGLPAGGQHAPQMPAMPGHAAGNTIDRMGGLDATGRTVDGNNAAGIAKGAQMQNRISTRDTAETILRKIAASCGKAKMKTSGPKKQWMKKADWKTDALAKLQELAAQAKAGVGASSPGMYAGTGAGAGVGGALLGAVPGALLGMGRGNTAEGLGRGILRGGGTGAGAGVGALLGANLAGPAHSGYGALAGAGLGGLAGYMGSGALLGEPMAGEKERHKKADWNGNRSMKVVCSDEMGPAIGKKSGKRPMPPKMQTQAEKMAELARVLLKQGGIRVTAAPMAAPQGGSINQGMAGVGAAPGGQPPMPLGGQPAAPMKPPAPMGGGVGMKSPAPMVSQPPAPQQMPMSPHPATAGSAMLPPQMYEKTSLIRRLLKQSGEADQWISQVGRAMSRPPGAPPSQLPPPAFSGPHGFSGGGALPPAPSTPSLTNPANGGTLGTNLPPVPTPPPPAPAGQSGDRDEFGGASIDTRLRGAMPADVPPGFTPAGRQMGVGAMPAGPQRAPVPQQRSPMGMPNGGPQPLPPGVTWHPGNLLSSAPGYR